jgi:hypothetical protein
MPGPLLSRSRRDMLGGTSADVIDGPLMITRMFVAHVCLQVHKVDTIVSYVQTSVDG